MSERGWAIVSIVLFVTMEMMVLILLTSCTPPYADRRHQVWYPSPVGGSQVWRDVNQARRDEVQRKILKNTRDIKKNTK